MRLIIADDHPVVLSGLQSLLAKSPHEVVASEQSGDAVLEKLTNVRPDALVLDVNMPGLSGLDVLRTLRRRGDSLPVVLLTGTLDDQVASEAVQLQVNGLVLKDTAAELLLKCLDEVQCGRRWIDRDALARAVDVLARPKISITAQLTAREREIARLVALGRRNRDIALELRLSEGTVKAHVHRIFEKTDISNRAQLVMKLKDEDFDR